MRWDAARRWEAGFVAARLHLLCGLALLVGCSGEVDYGDPVFDAATDAASGAAGQAGQMQLPAAGTGGGPAAHAGSGGMQMMQPPSGAGGAGGARPSDAGSSMDAGMPDAGAQPSGEPRVRFIGRTEPGQAGSTRLGWSGSGIAFRFAGTEASIALDDSAGFFTRVIDGHEVETLTTTPGERSYELASGLPDATHEVELYRRTEASFGETRYIDVDLGPDGTLLAPAVPPKRRIEMIGDSITCGYGNEGLTGDCPFEAATENHYLTYGAITARALDAELMTIAWSGKGIIYNYGDDKNEPLPALYDRAVPTDGSSQWDFADDAPDVVVINLGTNDFSTEDDPSESVFSDAYAAFLMRLRAHYPDAWIVCLAPTGLGGADLDTSEGYITAVVSQRKAAGDDKVVQRTLQFTSTGAGCSYHPSLATHASMADALTAQLENLLGW